MTMEEAYCEYSIFTNKDLVTALELLVSKQDLKQRDVAMAILGAFGFSRSDIVDQLRRNEFVDGVNNRNRLGLIKVL